MQFNLDQPVKFQGRFIASDLEIRKDHKVAVRATTKSFFMRRAGLKPQRFWKCGTSASP
jgi:hypothetical protein